MFRHNLGLRYLGSSDMATKLLSPSGSIITPMVTMRRGDNGSYNNCTPLHNVEVYRVAWFRCPGLDRLPYRFVKLQRQFPVPMPEIQTITKEFQNQVYSSILARIRIFKSLETNNENPTTEKFHSNVHHSNPETTKPSRPPIQVSLIKFISNFEPPLANHHR